MKTNTIAKVLLVFCLLFGARLCCFRADLPYLLSYTYSPIDQSDEGWWSRNARIYCRTGQWHDGTSFNPMVQSPVHTYLLTAFFSLVGVGWVQGRLLAVLLCLCACAAICTASRRSLGANGALAVTALFALHPLCFFFSRITTNEMTATALFVLALAVVVSRRQPTNGQWFLAGVLIVLAWQSKATAILVLPGCAVYLFKQTGRTKGLLATTLVAAGAGLCLLVIQAATPTFPSAGLMTAHYLGRRFVTSLAQAWTYFTNYWGYNFFIFQSVYAPILTFLTSFAVFECCRDLRRWRQWQALQLASVCWLVTSWFVFSLAVRHARYHLLLVLPLVIVGLTAGTRAYAKRVGGERDWPTMLFELLYAGLALRAAFQWRRLEATSIPLSSSYFTWRWYQYGASCIVLLSFLALARIIVARRKRLAPAPALRRAVVAAALCYVVVTNLAWLSISQYGTWEAMQRIRSHLSSPHACIAGTVADTLALELPNPTMALSWHVMRARLEDDLLTARPRYLVVNVPAPASPVKRYCEGHAWLKLFPHVCRLELRADLTPSIPPEGMKIYLYQFEAKQ